MATITANSDYRTIDNQDLNVRTVRYILNNSRLFQTNFYTNMSYILADGYVKGELKKGLYRITALELVNRYKFSF